MAYSMNGNGQAEKRARSRREQPRNDVIPEEISIERIIEVAVGSKWLILICFGLVLGCAAAYTASQPEEYRASTTLLIENQNSSPQLSALLNLNTGRRNISNEIEIIKSRTMALDVADVIRDMRYVPGTTKLLPILATEGDEQLSQMELAARLRSRIEARPVSREVDIIQLNAQSTLPEEATLIANSYADRYVEHNRTTSRSRMRASRELLQDVTVRFDSMLTQAEQEVMSYAEREGVIAPDEHAQQLMQQLMNLQRQQYEALFELEAAQAERDALEHRLRSVRPGIAEGIALGGGAMIEGLRARIGQLQIEIEEILSKNPELRDNPSQNAVVAQKQSQIGELKQQLNQRIQEATEQVFENQEMAAGPASLQEAAELVGGIQQEMVNKSVLVTGIHARLEVLREKIEAYQQQLDQIPDQSVILARLRRNVQTSEELFTTLYGKLQEARIAEQSELGYVDVVDPAVVSRTPVSPRVGVNVVIGSILGFLLGLGLAFMRDSMDNRIHSPDEIKKHGYTVLGAVSDMYSFIDEEFGGEDVVQIDGQTLSTRLPTLLNPISPISEQYKTIRTNIRYSRPDKTVRVLAVTSPIPGDGKSVTSINLGIALAQMGRRTLYIDADLRRPRGHEMMGLPRGQGLTNLLFDEQPPDFETFASIADNFYVIPAGTAVPNPTEVLESEKMRKFLAQCREEFAFVVIDTPPVLTVTDAMILARETDGVALVCSSDETTWQVLDDAVDRMEDMHITLLGVVLNRYDPKASDAGGYGYGYSYSSDLADDVSRHAAHQT